MESFIASYLFERYSLLVSSTCAQVPLGWQTDIEAMLRTLEDLPTEISCLLMIQGIEVDDRSGMLSLSLMAYFHLMPEEGPQRIQDAYKSTWTSVSKKCVDCGARGVRVKAREGMRILCLTCQDKRGIMCHAC